MNALRLDRLQLGVCYYPEHWPATLWEDDFRRMRESGFTVIRMAEFAWSIFEPAEGVFSFELFDRVMDLAHKYGLQVILGTPTATPPAWLTSAYPEVLNVTQTGVTYHHGQRRHYNYSSPVYQKLTRRIAHELAVHYKDHPALIGWQIDNELNCEVNVFYSEADHCAFRTWLETRYTTLDALNEAWGTVFWNQTYTDWSQVHLTRPTPSDAPNPHQALDEKRFISDATIAFARIQVDAIRAVDQRNWITTNGLFGHVDSHRMTTDLLDFLAYDSYPNFSTLWPDPGPEPLLDRRWSWNLSVVRGISPNFAIMEQQSGPGGWVNRLEQPAPKPGQMRLWTYQSIAHGADMVLYFRWRTATVGTEIYWHGINDYHNRPNRRVAEAARTGGEIAAVGEAIAGTTYQATVAILRDYDNEWDGELDVWHGPYDRQSALAWFKALQRSHIPVDVVYLRSETTAADLSRYKVLIYPHPAILTESAAKRLQDYVQNGGTVVFGCRTGYKDETGRCRMEPLPGPVSDLCGVTVEDFTRIGAYQRAPTVQWTIAEDSVGLEAGGFNDILHCERAETEILAVYGEEASYYAGTPVLTRHAYGRGVAYYYGAVFTAPLARTMIQHLGLVSPVIQQLMLPEAVELAVRAHSGGKRLVFLLNYAATSQTIQVRQAMINLLTGDTVSGRVEMEPYGVFLLCDASE